MAVDIIDDGIDGCQYDGMRLITQIEQCCSSLVETPLSETDAEALASMLRVLADPARLRLVSVIAAQPGAEACVCNLTAPLGLSQPTVSHHLKRLHEAGILEREQRGRWVYYSLRDGALERVASIFSSAPVPVG
jgi:ArsR family transcriptional regulator